MGSYLPRAALVVVWLGVSGVGWSARAGEEFRTISQPRWVLPICDASCQGLAICRMPLVELRTAGCCRGEPRTRSG